MNTFASVRSFGELGNLEVIRTKSGIKRGAATHNWLIVGSATFVSIVLFSAIAPQRELVNRVLQKRCAK